jgi:TRAP-type C4-dicarboxylate transport system permease small subunit
MLLGYLLLQLVLKLVTTVICLAVVAIVLYVGYKIFVSSNFQSKQ